jgi:ABC-type sugar transport system ATPase subunit
VTNRLALAKVTYRYQPSPPPALDAVDLDVEPGEIITVVGPSGSGKTTLLRLVTGLLIPDAGTITIDGRDVTRERPERRPVAMVFQGFALFPNLTVAANIEFGMKVRREQHIAERSAEVAERLELAGLLDRRPAELSGGERQRVALARALVRKPSVFCLDEPLASLDAALRSSARRLLAELLRADGRSAVLVTHDQVEAMTLGDRVAVLREGQIEQCATPREVYTQPSTEFVASFIGSPPATLLTSGTAGALGLVGAVTYAIRPEHVRLGAVGVPGTVREVADIGSAMHVTVEVNDGVLVATVAPDARLHPGAEIAVAVDRHNALRFDSDGRRV